MKVTLKTLSPVHIGSGDKITNWAYGVDRDRISIYRFDDIVNAFAGNIQKIETLKSQMERYALTKSAGDMIKEFNLNIKPFYTVTFSGEIKNNSGEYKQVFEFIKQAGNVYIPATEIKGAIRTAVMYVLLKELFEKNQQEKNWFLSELRKLTSKDIDKRNAQRKISKELEPALEEKIFREGSNIQSDMFRFLQISDTDLKHPQDVLKVVDVVGVGISKGFSEPHEVLKEGTEFSFSIEIKYNPKIHSSVTSKNASKLSFNFIKSALKEFYLKVLEEDINYFQNTQIKEFDSGKILESLKKRKELFEKAVTVSPIRIGKHQGFLSTTIGMLIKELDRELYKKLYPKLVPKGYENIPNKSRKLTKDGQLVGWAVIVWEQ